MSDSHNPNDQDNDEEVNALMGEPILLRDVTGSGLSQNLLEKWKDGHQQTIQDALVFLCDVLMQESGFKLRDDDLQTRRPGVYNNVYTHLQYEGLLFKLVCVPLGGNMVVHGFIGESPSPEEKYEFKLRPSEFVTQPFDSSNPKFRQLAKLSRLFKDALPYPLLQTATQKLGLPQIHGLLGLMPEIQLTLLTYLTAQSVASLAQTCSHFNTLSKEQVIWRRLYIAEFGKRSDMALNQDWLEFYKEKHRFKKEMHSRYGPHPTFVVPSFMERPHPLPPHVPVHPPFLGGDYDLNPAGLGVGAIPALVPRPRFDPIGPTGFDPLNPSPQPPFRPGRGGGMFDAANRNTRMGGRGSRNTPSFGGHFGGGSRLF